MSQASGKFDDGKAPDALRTIGELSRALGIRQHVLRYWEEQFPTLKPLKRSGGRRYYRPEDIALVQAIDRLVHREGYTLRGARLALASKSGSQPVVSDMPVLETSTDLALLGKLRTIRATLSVALASA